MYSKGYKKRVYRKRAAPKRKPAAKSSFAKRVTQVMRRVAEKKYIQTTNTNTVITSAITGGLFAPSFKILLPQISQGVTDNGRIGNEITISKNIFKGYVNCLPVDGLTNPSPADIYVKMWIVSIKSFTPLQAGPVASTWAQFFQGNNVGLNFQGNMLDLLLDVNQELFTLHKTKIIHLNQLNATGVSSRASVMTAPFYFDCTKYVKKVKYEDTNNLPSDRSLYCLFTTVYADGTANDSTDSVVEYHGVHHCYYSDL